MFFGAKDHQLEGAYFARDTPRCGLWFSMGLGKTLTTLAVLNHCRHHQLPSLPALILAPKRVCKTWTDQIDQWGLPMDYKVVLGKDKVGQFMGPPADVEITNFESLEAIEKYCKILKTVPWKTVVIDESSLLKSPKSKRWKLAKGLCDRVGRVIQLTGSPSSGTLGPQDIWGQVELLMPGHLNPLGTQYQFLNHWFTFDHFNRPKPRLGAEEEIAQLIAPWILRKDLDEVEMSELIPVDEPIELHRDAVMAYREAEAQETGGYAALRCIASGFQYLTHWSGQRRVQWLHGGKLERLDEIRNLTGERLLVFANFIEEIDRIRLEFGERCRVAFVDGRVPNAMANQIIDAWNSGTIDMLICNCKSMGHGVNLQGGGRRMVFFSLPDSGEVYNQAVARLWRTGQPHPVIVHRLVTAGTIDEAINRLLAKKQLSEQKLMDEVKRLRQRQIS